MAQPYHVPIAAPYSKSEETELFKHFPEMQRNFAAPPHLDLDFENRGRGPVFCDCVEVVMMVDYSSIEENCFNVVF